MPPADRAESFDGLPPVLREIAEVAGLEAALALARQYGGLEVAIPRRASYDHWLARCVGAKPAAQICDHFRVVDADGHAIGNFRLYIPQAGTGAAAQARQQLVADLEAGQLSLRAAARRAGLTERTARRIRGKVRDERQGSLFAGPRDPA